MLISMETFIKQLHYGTVAIIVNYYHDFLLMFADLIHMPVGLFQTEGSPA